MDNNGQHTITHHERGANNLRRGQLPAAHSSTRRHVTRHIHAVAEVVVRVDGIVRHDDDRLNPANDTFPGSDRLLQRHSAALIGEAFALHLLEESEEEVQ